MSALELSCCHEGGARLVVSPFLMELVFMLQTTLRWVLVTVLSDGQ